MEQLVLKLRKAGLVESIQRPQGRYRLSRPSSQLSASEILRIAEGPLEIVPCVGLEGKPKKEGDRAGECATRLLWTKMSQQMMAQLLDRTSLEELTNGEKD